MCVCVCVCVCVCMCMYIYPYISPQHICICISEFVFVPHMQDYSDMYHDVCTQYHCNKQVSNVFLSIQFDTNVSQLLRRVLPWSYDRLKKTMALE